jgi:transposase InsO family protein
LLKNNRIWVPEEEVNQTVRRLHEFFGHPGRSKLYNTIKTRITGIGLKKAVISTVSKCITCQKNKKGRTNHGELKGYLIAKKPGELICSDIVGPFEADYFNETGKFYVLTFIDVFSRYTKLYKIKKIDSNTISTKFKHYIKKNNNNFKIEAVLTDQGTQYRSQAFNDICCEHGIRQQFACTFTPTSNSIAERINRPLLRY